jgi:hypothetical protein
MKLCKDCVHYEEMPYDDICVRPTKRQTTDYVHGDTEQPINRPCQAERKSSFYSGSCGPDAKFFIPMAKEMP